MKAIGLMVRRLPATSSIIAEAGGSNVQASGVGSAGRQRVAGRGERMDAFCGRKRKNSGRR